MIRALSQDARDLLAADPCTLSPNMLDEQVTLRRRVDAAGRVGRLLARLDAATVDSSLAPDCRRVLTQESNTLRAASQRGDIEHTGRAVIEAERVMSMWGVS